MSDTIRATHTIQYGLLIESITHREQLGGCWKVPTYRGASLTTLLTTDLTPDVFRHGQYGIMRQLYKAFQSL